MRTLFRARVEFDLRRTQELTQVGVGAESHKCLLREVDRFAELFAVDLDANFANALFDLLANPRLLGLTAGILEGAVQEADIQKRSRKEAIESLDLRTNADVYALAYVTPGEYVDPAQTIPGQDDVANRRGLIASGLKDSTAWIGLKAGEGPDRTNYRQRLDRTATLLGAIAFEMLAQNTFQAIPDASSGMILRSAETIGRSAPRPSMRGIE